MDRSADSIRVVGEADLLELARVARSTWKHWCAQDVLSEAADGLYGERDVVETAVVAALIGALDLRRAKRAWLPARSAVVDRCCAMDINQPEPVQAVVDLHTWELRLTSSAKELFAVVVAQRVHPRGYVALSLSEIAAEARTAFWNRAAPAQQLKKDGRRRRGARRRSVR